MGLLHFWQEAFPTRQKKLSIREICVQTPPIGLCTTNLKEHSVVCLDCEWVPATEAGEVICDFCQRTSMTRVEPTEADLQNLLSRLSSLNWRASSDALGKDISNDVISGLSEQLVGNRPDHDWKPQMRALCVLEFFLCKGDDERIVANSIIQSQHNLLHYLAKEVPPLKKKALAVIQLSQLAKVLPAGENLSVEQIDGVLVLSSQRSTVTCLDGDSDSEVSAEHMTESVSSENSSQVCKKRVSFSEETKVFERPYSEDYDAETLCENSMEIPNHIDADAKEVLDCSPCEEIPKEAGKDVEARVEALGSWGDVLKESEAKPSATMQPGEECYQLTAAVTDVRHHGDAGNEPVSDSTMDETFDWTLGLSVGLSNDVGIDTRIGICDGVTKDAPPEESRRTVPFIPWGIERTIPEHKDSFQRFTETQVQALLDA